MKILTTLNSIDEFNEIKQVSDGIVLANNKVSARYDKSLNNDEILQLVKKCNTAKMDCYLLVTAIFQDDNISNAYDIINEFKDTNLLYIYSDLAIYEILKEFDIVKKGVYNPNTLITNYVDFLFWGDYKIKGLFPSLEIPLNDISVIGHNKKRKLYYKGFGYNVMFQSKRKLLTSYKDEKGLDINVNSDNLTLVEETRNEDYKIIENEFGTHIFQHGIHNILPAIDIITDDIDYLFLDGRFIEFNKYLEVINTYKDALCDLDHLNLYNHKIEKLFNNLTYDFLYEDSVFKKGDF